MISLLPLLALGGMAPAPADEPRITVPPGFEVSVFHEGVGPARHIAVRSNGDVYVSTRVVQGQGQGQQGQAKPPEPAIVALRDTDGDGKADLVKRFSDVRGTGIQFHDGKLYASSPSHVYRFSFSGNELVPKRQEVIVSGMPTNGFSSRGIAFDDRGGMFVSIGGGSNACPPGAPPGEGGAPCPDFANRAGIWRYRADRLDQKHPADGEHYASGVRDLMAIDWDPRSKALYAALQGRNSVHNAQPRVLTPEDNAEGIAEEFHRVRKGANLGWPSTYYDPRLQKRVLAPDYGGDGKRAAPEGLFADPMLTLPPHSSPLDLLIYKGKSFPAAYRGGAFVALHGGHNRAPLPQEGFQVVFVPLGKDGSPRSHQVFSDGFAGVDAQRNPAAALHRPSGLASGPNGSLYVVDSKKGRIWRIAYRGDSAPRR